MKVLLIGKGGCGKCNQAKDMLKKKNIEYKYLDVNTVDGMAELTYYGEDGRVLPVIVVKNKVFRSVIEAIKTIQG
ncbi:glutaredoxin family protein [bacterium]|nr:glutaredoxin family protein [bacterium]